MYNVYHIACSCLVAAMIISSCGGKSDTDGTGGSGGSGGDTFSACTKNSDCIVVPASCCGSCGAATRGDAAAINREQVSSWQTHACGNDMVGCPACYMAPDRTLLATCRANTCTIVDLKTDAASACTQDSECRVRTHECCECGGTISPQELVGISDETAYTSLVCDSGQSCAECAPLYPSEVTVQCASGHCTINDPRL